MKTTCDPAKHARNVDLRGLRFDRAAALDRESAWVKEDDQPSYGEIRFLALAFLEGRIHVLWLTPTPTGIRVISFRKANDREELAYERQKAAY